MSTPREDYEALATGIAYAPIERSRIALTGQDRVTFLQRFCTNDLRKLLIGGRCEAFIPSVQGKTLGHVVIYAESERLILDTSPSQAAKLIKHLDRYTLRDDVQYADLTGESRIMLVAGPQCLTIAPKLVKRELALLRECPLVAAPALYVESTPANATVVQQLLGSLGAREIDPPALEAARIEAGFPLYGQDITDDNLPQEVDRNAQAINFTKGCYLGQETIARIDALGHVNKLLRGLKFRTAEPPPVGVPLVDGDGKPVGQVTSSAFSPRFETAVGLGYVRRQQSTPGTRLSYAGGEVEVVPLPM